MSTLPNDSFLSSVGVYNVDPDGLIVDGIGAPVEQLVRQVIASGAAEISTDPHILGADASAIIAIPIHRGGQIVSVTVLSSKRIDENRDDLIGVFEVWEPVGIYEELALKAGFFGKMERFRNVSSFVRFEKGTGLPGQVWQQRASVIHDDLSNHPGFLRAAGASADLLSTAIGIPIAAQAYHGSALLISSSVSPLARGFEVWQAEGDRFVLVGGAYRGFREDVSILPESVLTAVTADAGLPGMASRAGGAVLCHDVKTIFAGRPADVERPEAACGLAIPCYDNDTLTSVATLLF